jgi:8-oxo-dGTP diphosphatase
MIEAAGGVVWRTSSQGRRDVLLIHRPRYDDWSHPKGKLHDGETALAGARREVLEETGLRCTTGIELPEVRYTDRKGRPKRVRYWTMQPVDGRFVPNHEVDRIRWVSQEDAAGLLTYERDLLTLAALFDVAFAPT